MGDGKGESTVRRPNENARVQAFLLACAPRVVVFDAASGSQTSGNQGLHGGAHRALANALVGISGRRGDSVARGVGIWCGRCFGISSPRN